MSASNSWADFAATFRRTRAAHQEHEGAKAELKKLVPEDAKEAIGSRSPREALEVRRDQLRRSDMEAADASLQ